MATASKPVARGDIILHRGSDEGIGVRWWQDRMDGSGEHPVDLSSWSAVLTLSRDGEALATVSCTCTYDGLAVAAVSASDISLLDPWRKGEWRIDATGPDGQRELLGWGYFDVVL